MTPDDVDRRKHVVPYPDMALAVGIDQHAVTTETARLKAVVAVQQVDITARL